MIAKIQRWTVIAVAAFFGVLLLVYLTGSWPVLPYALRAFLFLGAVVTTTLALLAGIIAMFRV
jgi:hypothetical protein